jgi:mxaJ protein
VQTTRPYYSSSYALVTRTGDPQPLHSLHDARLSTLRIGVQLIGNDLAASPPGHWLARHGATEHVVGFTVDGGSDGGEGTAAQRMVQALAQGRLDAALAWGPQVGWLAAQASPSLRLVLARTPADSDVPFEFSMAVAVRRTEAAWRERLQGALDARRSEIEALLDEWSVPRLPDEEAAR